MAKQTILTVVLEVRPERMALLRKHVGGLRKAEDPASPERERLVAGVPLLHFMSMLVFEDPHYDPVFVLEANFDGAPGPFWAQLEAALEQPLRAILRCCEPPQDATKEMFEAITRPGSRHPIAPYLEARSVRPAVRHQGNRGLTRKRVLHERALFERAQRLLEDKERPQLEDAAAVHHWLRGELLQEFDWLRDPPEASVPVGEAVLDWGRLLAFAFVALFCLSLPALVLALFTPALGVAALCVPAAVVLGVLLFRALDRPPPEARRAAASASVRGPCARRDRLRAWAKLAAQGVAALVAYWALLSALGGGSLALLSAIGADRVLPLPADPGFAAGFWASSRALLLGLLLGVPVSAAALLLWLRRLERRDPSQDAPPPDEDKLRKMAEREDRHAQNHMGSLVLVKPGVLRGVLIRAGLRGLGLALRVFATDGQLSGMRTIHFAHWALLSNGGRLLFLSNFDGTWDSYLDDFIEKANKGMTLAWGNCVGFPPSRFLLFGGAARGRLFKAWARRSMAETLFWYSAYPDFTVNQIQRHARVADGLRREHLDIDKKGRSPWIRDL